MESNTLHYSLIFEPPPLFLPLLNEYIILENVVNDYTFKKHIYFCSTNFRNKYNVIFTYCFCVSFTTNFISILLSIVIGSSLVHISIYLIILEQQQCFGSFKIWQLLTCKKRQITGIRFLLVDEAVVVTYTLSGKNILFHLEIHHLDS